MFCFLSKLFSVFSLREKTTETDTKTKKRNRKQKTKNKQKCFLFFFSLLVFPSFPFFLFFLLLFVSLLFIFYFLSISFYSLLQHLFSTLFLITNFVTSSSPTTCHSSNVTIASSYNFKKWWNPIMQAHNISTIMWENFLFNARGTYYLIRS